MWMWKKFRLAYRKPLLGTKSPGKGGKDGNGLVFESAMWHWKLNFLLNITFANKIIMFEKILEF
jgi:hypothetical protein